jgi:hypothetical protein
MAAVGVSACSVAIILAGCAGSEQWIGQVTTLQPELCVGRHAAMGDCFEANPSVFAHLHVGECVIVTYTPHDEGASVQTLSNVKEVAASSDPADCPS